MTHFASPEFWFHYRQLPNEVRELADQKFSILKCDPSHLSLRLKKVGQYWSIRVGLNYRALAKSRHEGLLWFWVGPHSEYDSIISYF